MTPREKYHSDPNYKLLVDWMVKHIEDCNYTPSEMREASLLASIIHEQMQVRPNFIIVERCMKILDGKE